MDMMARNIWSIWFSTMTHLGWDLDLVDLKQKVDACIFGCNKNLGWLTVTMNKKKKSNSLCLSLNLEMMIKPTKLSLLRGWSYGLVSLHGITWTK